MPDPELKVFPVQYINTQLAKPTGQFTKPAGSPPCSKLTANVTCPEAVATKS
jgi:hypothetical protein